MYEMVKPLMHLILALYLSKVYFCLNGEDMLFLFNIKQLKYRLRKTKGTHSHLDFTFFRENLCRINEKSEGLLIFVPN
jgi:hypothetical protein